MTIINNIEIDDIQYKRNIIKEALVNNDPIEDKLHVILCISNPCLYARRYILIKEFLNRMDLEESDVLVYVVELAYKKQRFIITEPNNPRHLQIRTEIPIWHKENMINLGVQKLLPKNWKAMAWIDSDIEFDNPTWAKDTLKVLNGTKDIVQLFGNCIDMDKNEEAMNIFTSFGHQYCKGLPYSKTIIQFWHPGFAWACTRKAYEKMGGLYEKGILGSGDNIMALCLIQRGLKSVNENSTEDYKNSIIEFQERVKTLRLGYIPGVIRHYFHGSKQNRRYHDRWQILLKYDYSPSAHVTNDKNGVLVPTKDCPEEMLNEIMEYFKERNEDEFYQKPNLYKEADPDTIEIRNNLSSFENMWVWEHCPSDTESDEEDTDDESDEEESDNESDDDEIEKRDVPFLSKFFEIFGRFIMP
jgi:hypothetical protein